MDLPHGLRASVVRRAFIARAGKPTTSYGGRTPHDDGSGAARIGPPDPIQAGLNGGRFQVASEKMAGSTGCRTDRADLMAQFSRTRVETLIDVLQPSRLTRVVDIGANPINDNPYKNLLDMGGCEVWGFEPQEPAFNELMRTKRENEHYLPYAIGDGTRQSALKDSARGKVVFIAGASRGIGEATAMAFAEAGARAVYITARSEEALTATRARVQQANPDTDCAYAVCDVTRAAEVEAAVADCVARFGGIDVADANAGYLGPWVKIGLSEPEGWWHSWEVNVRGAYHVARFTLPHLVQSAERHAATGRSGGHLILLSSIGAQLLMEGASDYQTSKHAINRLCEFIQTDHGAEGIKCFALHPGGVATELGKSMPETLHAYLNDTPDLAACFAVWLASGAADWARGRYLAATWDVTELTAMKDTILETDLLVNRLRARP